MGCRVLLRHQGKARKQRLLRLYLMVKALQLSLRVSRQAR